MVDLVDNIAVLLGKAKNKKVAAIIALAVFGTPIIVKFSLILFDKLRSGLEVQDISIISNRGLYSLNKENFEVQIPEEKLTRALLGFSKAYFDKDELESQKSLMSLNLVEVHISLQNPSISQPHFLNTLEIEVSRVNDFEFPWDYVTTTPEVNLATKNDSPSENDIIFSNDGPGPVIDFRLSIATDDLEKDMKFETKYFSKDKYTVPTSTVTGDMHLLKTAPGSEELQNKLYVRGSVPEMPLPIDIAVCSEDGEPLIQELNSSNSILQSDQFAYIIDTLPKVNLVAETITIRDINLIWQYKDLRNNEYSGSSTLKKELPMTYIPNEELVQAGLSFDFVCYDHSVEWPSMVEFVSGDASAAIFQAFLDTAIEIGLDKNTSNQSSPVPSQPNSYNFPLLIGEEGAYSSYSPKVNIEPKGLISLDLDIEFNHSGVYELRLLSNNDLLSLLTLKYFDTADLSWTPVYDDSKF